MNSFRIKGIGLLILVMMAVRVSITPGVRHQHEHGDHPHSHQHGHSHGHPHSHSHEPLEADSAETHSSTSHVHIFIFGWELTFSSPIPKETTAPSSDAVAESPDDSPQVDALPFGPVVTSATSWGSLIGWVFDLKSTSPPLKLALSKGLYSEVLVSGETGFSSRDRDKPMLPPPERVFFEVARS